MAKWKLLSMANKHFIWLISSMLVATAAMSKALNTDKTPIKIAAGMIFVDQSTKNIRLNQAVSITQGDFQLNADCSTVDKTRQGGHFFQARGHSKLQKKVNYHRQLELLQAQANTLSYDDQQRKLELQGNAAMSLQKNKLQGGVIRYNALSHHYEIDADQQHKASLVFYPH